MLRRIQVSGFKSLFNFELEFRPGLNVLVGPNGSGKTNIISFIEFLSFLTREPLLDAVGRSGGAGRIFRRNATGTLTKQIWFCASGDCNFHSFRQGQTGLHTNCRQMLSFRKMTAHFIIAGKE